MASAFEKRPGQFWAKYKDQYGRWRGVSTRARTKRQALKIALELKRRAERIRTGVERDDGVAADENFAWLANWWINEFSGRLRSHGFLQYLQKHAIPAFGHVPLRQLG